MRIEGEARSRHEHLRATQIFQRQRRLRSGRDGNAHPVAEPESIGLVDGHKGYILALDARHGDTLTLIQTSVHEKLGPYLAGHGEEGENDVRPIVLGQRAEDSGRADARASRTLALEGAQQRANPFPRLGLGLRRGHRWIPLSARRAASCSSISSASQG